MRKLGSKKRFVLVASTAAAVLVGSGVAFAYWTTTGNGTGSATTGTDHGVTVTSNVPSGLYPGGPAQPLNLTITPNAPAQPSYIANVAVAVTGTSDPLCLPADFIVTDATIGATVPAAGQTYAGGGAGTGATIRLNDSGVPQNECKNATVTLGYTAS